MNILNANVVTYSLKLHTKHLEYKIAKQTADRNRNECEMNMS